MSVASTDMSTVEITLEHPDMTTITLVAAGEARNSRELHTVFDDNANATLATVWPPFDDDVRPHEALSAFQG